MVGAQLENSMALGWKPEDLVVVSNLKIDGPATIVRAPLNESCLTGSKMFALQFLFEQGAIQGREMWWAHDLDAWQNYWFEPPECDDIGLAEYSTPKFNGGSVFVRSSAWDIIATITERIQTEREHQEEPAINYVLHSLTYKHRVTKLDSTFNVGCSAYAVRYQRSMKPILVSHFRPTTRTSWRTHVDGVNGLGIGSVSPRLLQLLIERFHGGIHPDFSKTATLIDSSRKINPPTRPCQVLDIGGTETAWNNVTETGDVPRD